MTKERFEELVEEAYNSLPEAYRAIENVRIVVEDRPSDEVLQEMGMKNASGLLGLYQGIPLSKRGTAYGMYPVVPDTISLYRHNIVSIAKSEAGIRTEIRDTLIHEIGHYFGLSESEIRNAGY